MKKYTVNIDYFKSINTIDKAYFLGLLYADGYIGNSKSRGKEMQLGLIDLNILKIFNTYLESNHLIHPIKIKYIGCSQGYRLSIIRDELYDDLIKLGCFPKKSLILKFPTLEQVSNEFISHFIRGYFDGDGCISIKTYGKASVQIAGTKEFLKSIKLILNNLAITCNIRPDKNINILYFAGTNNIKKFYNFIYQNKNNIFLERKYNKFKELFIEQKIRIKKQIEKSNRKCIIENCNSKHIAKGFCSIHYYTNITKFKNLPPL